jgi:hypothetical protein
MGIKLGAQYQLRTSNEKLNQQKMFLGGGSPPHRVSGPDECYRDKADVGVGSSYRSHGDHKRQQILKKIDRTGQQLSEVIDQGNFADCPNPLPINSW